MVKKEKPSGVEVSIIIFIIVFFYWEFIPNTIESMRLLGSDYTYYIPLILSYIVTTISTITLFLALGTFTFEDKNSKLFNAYKGFVKYGVFYITIIFIVFSLGAYLFDSIYRNIASSPLIFTLIIIVLIITLIALVFKKKLFKGLKK